MNPLIEALQTLFYDPGRGVGIWDHLAPSEHEPPKPADLADPLPACVVYSRTLFLA